jgi:Cytochrome c3
MTMSGPTALKRLLVFLVVAALADSNPMLAQKQDNSEQSQLTSQRLRGQAWWPTRPDAAREDYVGTTSCAACHKQIALTQQGTPMAHAASRASETDLLRSNPKLSFSTPPYQTVITSSRLSSTYTVTSSSDSMSGRLLWSIGAGVKGQTFLLDYLGITFESQLSYFPSISGLDITPEHPRGTPQFLESAFGAPQTAQAAQQCFACHTTTSTVRRQFDPEHATPGVTCEACHGPGARHVKEMKARQLNTGSDAILDPASFGPVQLVDFCGACHRAPLDVTSAKDFTPLNVRFQPYRLSKSRCWSRPDPRITCIACHNPHEPLVRDAGSYDAKCLACHSAANTGATVDASHGLQTTKPSACPVSTDHCVSCHMPKYPDPQFHGSFTDHDIRIVRPGDPYPL